MILFLEETHEREKDFQLAKRRKRFLETFEEGNIPAEQISEADQMELANINDRGKKTRQGVFCTPCPGPRLLAKAFDAELHSQGVLHGY